MVSVIEEYQNDNASVRKVIFRSDNSSFRLYSNTFYFERSQIIIQTFDCGKCIRSSIGGLVGRLVGLFVGSSVGVLVARPTGRALSAVVCFVSVCLLCQWLLALSFSLSDSPFFGVSQSTEWLLTVFVWSSR